MKILREIKRCTEEVLYSIIHSEDFFVIAFLLMMMIEENDIIIIFMTFATDCSISLFVPSFVLS